MISCRGALAAARQRRGGGWRLSARAHRLQRCSRSCDCAQRKAAAERNRVPPRFFLSDEKKNSVFHGKMGQELVGIRQSCYRRRGRSSDKRFKRPGLHIALPALCAPPPGVSFTLWRLDRHSLNMTSNTGSDNGQETSPSGRHLIPSSHLKLIFPNQI